jgi:hypothetical protein
MTDGEVSTNAMLAESQQALSRSIWPMRFCAVFFFGVAALCAILFVFQTFIYRLPTGESYAVQPWAWFNLLGHVVRGIVAAFLAQRILLASHVTQQLIQTSESATAEEFDRATITYFGAMRRWWTTCAWCLLTMTIFSVAAVLIPLMVVYNNQGFSKVYKRNPQGTSDVKVAFHIAHDSPKDGYIEKEIPDLGQTIYLQPKPIITNVDVETAQVVLSPEGQAAINVSFTHNAGGKVRQNTTVYRGERLAILVDDKVITAPIIRDTIGDKAMITGAFDREEAERIAEGMVGAR